MTRPPAYKIVRAVAAAHIDGEPCDRCNAPAVTELDIEVADLPSTKTIYVCALCEAIAASGWLIFVLRSDCPCCLPSAELLPPI